MNFKLHLLRIEKLLCALTSWKMLFGLLRSGVLAGSEHRKILSAELRTIVDIGANKGQFSLACRRWSPNAMIISFEPLSQPYNIYNKLFLGDKNIESHPYAIGPNHERRVINISAHIDSSSLLPIGENQISHYPGTEKIGEAEIEMLPLDHVLSRSRIIAPALLKLDVQGFEFDALVGCEALLGCFDLIYCECSFIELYVNQKLVFEITNWLQERNFILAGVYNCSYDQKGRALQADFLFHRNDSRFAFQV